MGHRGQLTDSQQRELERLTCSYIEKARTSFPQRAIRDVNIAFNLSGSAAGQYHAGECLIKYNPLIAALHFKEFSARTVPHEVAHHIVWELSPGRKKQIRPHGREWKTVMHIFGVTNIRRCHEYDLAGIKVKRQRRVKYQCKCNTHDISQTIHNRIQKGGIYCCKRCNQRLRQVPEFVL